MVLNGLNPRLLWLSPIAILLASGAGAQTQGIPLAQASEQSAPGTATPVALPLSSTESMNDEEVDAISHAFGQASVIGLGEATHGTREFALLRHALILQMAKKGRVGAITLEATYANMLPINRYVNGGPGNVTELLDRMKLWPWRTTEMRDLIEAVSLHNQGVSDPQRKISFVGYDIQQIDAALAYVRNRYSSKKPFETVRADVEQLSAIAALPDFYSKLDADKILALREVAAFVERVAGRDEEALMVAQNLRGAADMWGESDLRMASARREGLSAEMIRSIARRDPRRATIVWAHNGHVMTFETQEGGFKYETLGHRLRAIYGDDYFALGLGFRQGGVLAFDPEVRKLRAFQTAAGREGSLDGELTRDTPAAFVNLRSDLARARFGGRQVSYRQIEASVTNDALEQAYVEDDITRLFDGWLSVGEATASQPLARTSQ